MNDLKHYIVEAFRINKNTKLQKYNYFPKTTNELKDLVKKLVHERGWKADLNDIDTSEITDMDYLFQDIFPLFNGNISKWDVSNVITMRCMFEQCHRFEGKGLNNWDISNCEKFNSMFSHCDSLKIDNIEEWGNKIKSSANIKYMFSPNNRKPSWYKE